MISKMNKTDIIDLIVINNNQFCKINKLGIKVGDPEKIEIFLAQVSETLKINFGLIDYTELANEIAKKIDYEIYGK